MNPAIKGCQLQFVIPSETSWPMQIEDHPLQTRIRDHCNEPAITFSQGFVRTSKQNSFSLLNTYG